MRHMMVTLPLLGIVLTLGAGLLSTYAVLRRGVFQLGVPSPFPALISIGQLVTFAVVLWVLLVSGLHAVSAHHWGWLAALVFAVPVGLVGWLTMTFDGLVGWGALAMLPPVLTLLYSLVASGGHKVVRPDPGHSAL